MRAMLQSNQVAELSVIGQSKGLCTSQPVNVML